MKKNLLVLAAVAFAGTVTAQLTAANEPNIGASSLMYLCDSNVVNMEAVSGTGVTWDYSLIGSYPGETRTIEVVDATISTYASDFPNSAKAFVVPGLVTNFMTSDANGRVSQGFVFSEATLGDVKAKFTSDNATMMTYPFAYGASLQDNYAGNIEFTLGGTQTAPASGTIHAAVDGEGTLIVGGTSVPNVIRYKSIDTAVATITFPPMEVQLIRTQFEYYDLANQDLPVFIHASVLMLQAGSSTPMGESSLVLSKYQPASSVGIEELTTASMEVYPNPSQGAFHIGGTYASGNATVATMDGKVVYAGAITPSETISTMNWNSGVYLVTLEVNGQMFTKKLTVK